MRFESLNKDATRFTPDAGIAIGPILFIIAVLGILATAIAAGSGSFTTSTTGESSRTKASAMIDIGQNLKVGVDRVMARGAGGEGTSLLNVIIDEDHTDGDSDLFSPTGGGIAPPSVALARDPANNVWHYPLAQIPGIGTSHGSRLAVLEVSEAVCDEINTKLYGFAEGKAAGDHADLGAWEGAISYVTGGKIALTYTNWPVADFKGKATGCLENDNGTPAFYFYQVIGID